MTVRGKVLFNEPMALHTSLKVGGPADCFAIPADEDDLLNLYAFLSRRGIPCLVVGGGYNLLVRDGGFKGVAISLEDFSHLEYTCSNCIRAGAGVDNRILSAFAAAGGLGGLEFLTGIPGKLGGALAMNAGAGGLAIMDRVEEIVSLVHGAITKKRKDHCEFGYRFLKLAPGEIVLGALFRLEREEKSVISQRVEAFLAHRKSTQQVGFPNAGSFFKNPAVPQDRIPLIENAAKRLGVPEMVSLRRFDARLLGPAIHAPRGPRQRRRARPRRLSLHLQSPWPRRHDLAKIRYPANSLSQTRHRQSADLPGA